MNSIRPTGQPADERAAALIIRRRHILLIHRYRASEDYFVIPGGHVEAGETIQEACVREMHEETGLEIAWIEFGFSYVNVTPGRSRLGHYFFVEPLPGEPVLSGPEIDKRAEDNRYVLEWVRLDRLAEISLRPEKLRKALAAAIAENGALPSAAELARLAPRIQAYLAG
jgi:8-oxo-dGTP diphosphatase